MVLLSSISNFFTNKTSLANKWMSFSSSNLALPSCTWENAYWRKHPIDSFGKPDHQSHLSIQTWSVQGSASLLKNFVIKPWPISRSHHCTGGIDTVKDFLFKLDMKPWYSSSGNRHFFTKYCQRQTYQNYEKPPRTPQNYDFQSHFSVLKTGWIFPILFLWNFGGNQIL